jgi:hypothetical protein
MEACRRRGEYFRLIDQLLADPQLSGALPVKPESACIQACNKYGAACSGVFFDSAKGKCYLKGTRTSSWTFSESVSEDGVDLVGGCALWANIGTSISS